MSPPPRLSVGTVQVPEGWYAVEVLELQSASGRGWGRLEVVALPHETTLAELVEQWSRAVGASGATITKRGERVVLGGIDAVELDVTGPEVEPRHVVLAVDAGTAYLLSSPDGGAIVDAFGLVPPPPAALGLADLIGRSSGTAVPDHDGTTWFTGEELIVIAQVAGGRSFPGVDDRLLSGVSPEAAMAAARAATRSLVARRVLDGSGPLRIVDGHEHLAAAARCDHVLMIERIDGTGVARRVVAGTDESAAELAPIGDGLFAVCPIAPHLVGSRFEELTGLNDNVPAGRQGAVTDEASLRDALRLGAHPAGDAGPVTLFAVRTLSRRDRGFDGSEVVWLRGRDGAHRLERAQGVLRLVPSSTGDLRSAFTQASAPWGILST